MTVRAATGPARAVVLAASLLLMALVVVAAERARATPSALGRALGIEPLTARLATIADTLAVAHHEPTAAQIAFARRAGAAAPLNALPYYIAAAAGGPATTQQRRVLADMALRRDPRLRPAWSWMVADRVARQDGAGIARALIRLAVLSDPNQQIWTAIAQISADPAARAEIKREIQRGAPWRDTYLTALSGSPVDRAVVFEMLQSVGKHPPVTNTPVAGPPDDQRAFLAALIARKEYERAYLAWVQWLPAASQDAVGHVFDGQFRGRVALPPFSWRVIEGTGGATAIDPATGLTLDYAGDDTVAVAEQTLLLSPGRYRIVTQAKFDAIPVDAGVSPVTWSVACLPDAKPLADLAVPLDGAEHRVAGAAFDVPATCQAQTLSLKVGPVDFGKRAAGHIRAVTIEAIK